MTPEPYVPTVCTQTQIMALLLTFEAVALAVVLWWFS